MKRQSAAWRKLAAQVLREESECWLCGHPIDVNAPPRSRWSGSVDHVIPLKLGGASARHNTRAAHYGCNSSKGARLEVPRAKTSRLL